MVFTDPPYNINYKGQGKNTSNTILADNVEDTEFDVFLTKVFKNFADHTKGSAGNYVFPRLKNTELNLKKHYTKMDTR